MREIEMKSSPLLDEMEKMKMKWCSYLCPRTTPSLVFANVFCILSMISIALSIRSCYVIFAINITESDAKVLYFFNICKSLEDFCRII